MNADKYIDHIEAYFAGQMTDKEKQLFEQEQKTNPELADAIKRYEVAKEAMDLLSEQAMRKQFQEWRKKNDGIPLSPEANVVPFSKKWFKAGSAPHFRRLAVAASILILLSVAGYFIINKFSSDSRLFASFNKPIAAERLMSSQKVDLQAAVEAYQNKKYDQAITLFKTIDPPTDFIDFYLGHSFYLKGDYLSAEPYFKAIMDRSDTSLKQEAEWGLLASLYHLENRKEAFDALLARIVGDERHSFYEEALEVKTRLKNER